MGRGYVIDYCIASFKKEKEEEAYRNYIAELLRISVEQRGGVKVKSLNEILHPPKAETRTADEIIEHIKSKLRGSE